VTTLGPNTTAGTYEFQVQDLLHDPVFNRWSQAQIDYYVNQARVQLVMDTGCLRLLQQPTYLTQGQEQYFFGQVTGAVITAPGTGYTAPTVTFSGGGGSGAAATLTQSGGGVNTITFTNFGANYTSAPTALISDPFGVGAAISVGVMSFLTWDILGINLLWGTEKYALQWRPFRVFSAWLRPFTPAAYQRQPVAWAVYGDNSFFVGPVPDQSYQVEYDTIILPTDFATGDTTTVDAIPRRNQDPIKFWAAYLAKKNARAFGEAESFKADYYKKMMEVVGAYTGRVPDVYQEG
jgi:hypothetical protein